MQYFLYTPYSRESKKRECVIVFILLWREREREEGKCLKLINVTDFFQFCLVHFYGLQEIYGQPQNYGLLFEKLPWSIKLGRLR